jgi:DNA-binding IclR family transcriptional regulator
MDNRPPSADSDGPADRPRQSSRPSPPTRRVVQILGLLGAHPDDEWTLASIAQRLEMTRSTALAILNELREASFVVRGAGKTYTLGPALLTLGRAADARFPSLQTIVAELTPYVVALRCGASIAFVEGPDLVTAQRFGSESHFLRRDVLAIRVPFAFPYGAGLAVWREHSIQEEWAAGADMTAPQRRRLDSTLAQIRRAGYEVLGPRVITDYVVAEVGRSILSSTDPSLHPVVTQLQALLSERAWSDWFLTNPDPHERYSIGLISAPIFDAQRFPRFSVALHLNGQEVSGARAMEIGASWRDEAQRVTEILGGEPPNLHT